MTTPVDIKQIRITLRYSTVVKDSAGTPVTTWHDGASVWAKKTTHRSDESVQAAALTGTQVHNLRIYYRTDVNASWRIKHGNTYYSIIAPPIEVREGAMRYLDITVKEVK